MEPIILDFDIKKLMQQNIIWTALLTVICVVLNFSLQHTDWDWSLFFVVKHILLFVIYYAILIVLHEVFHLIGFIIFGKASLRSISFGFKPEQGIAYATTNKRLSNRAMKAALLLPFWITGVVPTIIGFYFNSYTFIIVGAFLMAGAVGDFMMYFALRKFPNNYLVQDDAEKPTLYVYRPEI